MDSIGSPESSSLLTLNQLVLGSSPSAPTNEFKHLGQFPRTGLFAFGGLVARLVATHLAQAGGQHWPTTRSS